MLATAPRRATLLVLAALALFFSQPAAAQAEPTFRLSPTCGPNTTSATAQGAGFEPSLRVSFYAGGQLVGAQLAASDGSVAASLNLSSLGTAGPHQVDARQSPNEAVLLASQTFTVGAACPDVAYVSALEGQLEVLQSDSTWAPLVEGGWVKQYDEIRTLADSRASLLFGDLSTLELAANTRVRLNQFAFTSPDQGQSWFAALEGTFRYVGGQIASTGSNKGIDFNAVGSVLPYNWVGISGTELVGRHNIGTNTLELYLGEGALTPRGSASDVSALAVVYLSALGSFTVGPLTQQEYDDVKNGAFPPPPPVPTLTGFTPTTGPVGTEVTINGTNLDTATAVTFGGIGATFQVVSATEITATVPAGAATGTIAVTTPGGTATSIDNFVVSTPPEGPSISSFSPDSGGPGTSVTIQGTNLTGATEVTFGGVSAAFRFKGKSLTATVPAGATTGPIVVTTPDGLAVSAAPFTIPEAPVVDSISPTSGPTGTVVTILGSGFGNASFVRFGNSKAAFIVVSSTTIEATVPKGAKTGQVSVTTPGGTATSAEVFTVTK